LVQFAATPVNGGNNPGFQWYRNGIIIPGETNNIYSSSLLSNADEIICTMSSSESCVTISSVASSAIVMSVDQMPTPANAGPDQNITVNTTSLAGNEPLVGTGLWSQISGGGFIADVTESSTSVGGLPDGVNIYRWTITNGVCPDSYDEVRITVGTPEPFVINGPGLIEPGNTYTFFVPNEPGASYIWIVPPGATIISGNGTSSITVSFAPGSSGTIYVSKTGGPTGNASASKDIANVTAIKDPLSVDSYTIFPNPFMEATKIVINSAMKARMTVTIFDTKGVIYLTSNEYSTNEEIWLGEELRSGVYIIQVQYSDRLATFRIVKTQ
jgi:hypothetical protein